jgi:LmbE family N-acetylglucosaminyl deacetylase
MHIAQRLIALYQSLRKTGMSDDFVIPNNGLARGEKILILAPHEDDEALMCSGIISYALTSGADIKAVIITNGDHKGRKRGIIRMRETLEAMKYLGLKAANIIFLGYGYIELRMLKNFLSVYKPTADFSRILRYFEL